MRLKVDHLLIAHAHFRSRSGRFDVVKLVMPDVQPGRNAHLTSLHEWLVQTLDADTTLATYEVQRISHNNDFKLLPLLVKRWFVNAAPSVVSAFTDIIDNHRVASRGLRTPPFRIWDIEVDDTSHVQQIVQPEQFELLSWTSVPYTTSFGNRSAEHAQIPDHRQSGTDGSSPSAA
jgi:hypothetical protein